MRAAEIHALPQDVRFGPGGNVRACLERLAFRCYVKSGYVPPHVQALLNELAQATTNPVKFNPNHDEQGRFTFGPGGNDTSVPDTPQNDEQVHNATDSASQNNISDSQGDIGHEDTHADTPATTSGQPARNLSISQAGVNFIAQHEEFRSSVYLDDAGRPTIGYGHELKPEESFPDGMTKEEAETLLRNDISVAEKTVQKRVTVNLTQNQFDALVSFTYNTGIDAFRTSTLLRLLNQGLYGQAAGQFSVWHYVRSPGGGHQSDRGLVNRRSAETNLFLNGTYE
jgi:lysozyme